jgi:Icc-related predicted phosphoesterase
LFPNSKALDVRASSTLVVNGVTFALEPYAKRVSFRSIRKPMSSFNSLPFCDVLVSHEPPKGVLDHTYHGFSAGSSYLRDAVTIAKTKPRLWLCGHIHEGEIYSVFLLWSCYDCL